MKCTLVGNHILVAICYEYQMKSMRKILEIILPILLYTKIDSHFPSDHDEMGQSYHVSL